MCKRLFRGKRSDNGEWVFGRLLADDVIVPENQPFEVEGNRIHDELMAYVVLPETVSQYTGLKDKHGWLIFENDIVMKRTYNGKKPMRVVFSFGCFHCGWGGGSSTASHPYTLDDRQIEVIGNIHDNPDLLPQKENPV